MAKSWTVETESKLDDQLVPLARQAAQVSLIVVGGLYFRCQCLANRSACHLKLRAFDACLDDAGAALAALGAAPGDTRPLTLKLLARRGMALCQLSRYADAKTDYERALAIDPGNAQLQKDLQTIDAMLGK